MEPSTGLTFVKLIVLAGYALETVGVFIIVAGFVIASVTALGRYLRHDRDGLSRGYRRKLGESMLLGLEFLVAGDIIRTVIVDASINDVLSLGLVVLIRTVLVYSIHLEVEGRWPWQSGN